jgi:hypothetical protein
MALVEIARFYDLAEAQIAVSALRAAGLNPFLQGAEQGAMNNLSIRWQGGLRLWVLDAERELAEEIIQPHNDSNPDALAWGRHPQALRAAPLAVASTFLGGALALGLGRGRASDKAVLKLGRAVIYAALIGIAVLVVWQMIWVMRP